MYHATEVKSFATVGAAQLGNQANPHTDLRCLVLRHHSWALLLGVKKIYSWRVKREDTTVNSVWQKS
jgi:hypothetical protein